MKIIESCFNKKTTILFNKKREEDVLTNFLIRGLAIINLSGIDGYDILKRNKRFQNIYTLNETHVRAKIHPISSVTIVVSTIPHLIEILNDLRDSIWWNHEALFLIINTDPEPSCQIAEIFLRTLWTFNILFAVYLCRDLNDQVFLYTFNPYASISPESCKKAHIDNFYSEPWTLFFLPIITNFWDSNSNSEYIFHEILFCNDNTLYL